MTTLISINGKPAGKIITSPGGVPYVDPGLFGVLRHINAPVPILPYLEPGAFAAVLSSLPSMFVIPGVGVITTQRLA